MRAERERERQRNVSEKIERLANNKGVLGGDSTNEVVSSERPEPVDTSQARHDGHLRARRGRSAYISHFRVDY
jgi:hypothetical protein